MDVFWLGFMFCFVLVIVSGLVSVVVVHYLCKWFDKRDREKRAGHE